MSDEAMRSSPQNPLPPQIPEGRDRSKHVFFVSHATASDNAPFETFFKDLSRDVEQLVERGRVDVGFIDRDMRAGDDWERKILDAAGTCQVFVPLLSAPFFASEYCGKEFEAFCLRRTWRRADKTAMDEAKCVLPVIWAPTRNEPSAMSRFQRFTPDSYDDHELAHYYEQHGIFGLLQHERETGFRYRGTVWCIALEIQRLVEEYWVEPDVPLDSAGLRNAFDEGGKAAS